MTASMEASARLTYGTFMDADSADALETLVPGALCYVEHGRSTRAKNFTGRGGQRICACPGAWRVAA